MPTVYILVGIPTSGKSTWAKNHALVDFYRTFKSTRIISRDDARMKLFDLKKYDDYKFTSTNEDRVTDLCNDYLERAIKGGYNIIVDNTHCKEYYIDNLIKRFQSTNYTIKVKFFDVPLWKAWWRNRTRSKKESKSVPWSALKQMRKSYKKINKKKYSQYAEA